MKNTHKASQQAKGQKRDRSGKFAPEGRPAPTANLGKEEGRVGLRWSSQDESTERWLSLAHESVTAEPGQEEETLEVLKWLHPGSAVSDGLILTSQNISGYETSSGDSFNPIVTPLQDTLAICEELMSVPYIDIKVEAAVEDSDAPSKADADEFMRHLTEEIKGDIRLAVRKNVKEKYTFVGVEMADLPFKEGDGRFYSDTMYFNVESDTDEEGRNGIRLHVAGFEQYDHHSGAQIGWMQASVFYAFPDPAAMVVIPSWQYPS